MPGGGGVERCEPAVQRPARSTSKPRANHRGPAPPDNPFAGTVVPRFGKMKSTFPRRNHPAPFRPMFAALRCPSRYTTPRNPETFPNGEITALCIPRQHFVQQHRPGCSSSYEIARARTCARRKRRNRRVSRPAIAPATRPCAMRAKRHPVQLSRPSASIKRDRHRRPRST
jgi:hypothetical protein